MDVMSFFKPAGDGVRVLVVHSTSDNLGQDTTMKLLSNLKPEIAVTEERVSTLADLATRLYPAQGFHVVVLIAHGDKASNKAWLFGDVDVDGNDIGTNAGVLKAALDGLLDNCLCLFGVCYFGQDLLREAIIDQGGALACIAPKPDCTISNSNIQDEFAALLNEMQVRKTVDIGVDNLGELLKKTLSCDLHKKLMVITAAT